MAPMSIPRKVIAITLLISGLLTGPVAAENRGSQFSLSLDALGQSVFPNDWSQYALGIGGQAFLDWRPVQFISLGFGGQYGYFFYNSVSSSAPTFQLYTFDLAGRLFPTGTSRLGEFYLQGGVGLNLKAEPGHYHGYAGLGWRQFIQKDFALDLGTQYDYYSPQAANLDGISAKLGFTFIFGRDDWSEPQPAFVPRARTFVVGAKWTGPSTYVWQKESSLRKVAFEVYGDESLYPLILDANKDLITKEGFRPGIKLRIPLPPATNDELDRVERLALTDDHYLQLEEKSEGRLPEAYTPRVSAYTWKFGDDLPSVAQKLYGDEDLYPLLVDANYERLILPANLVPGKILRVPKLPSEDVLSEIRQKASTGERYLFWRNISEEHYRNIRPGH